MLVPNLELVGVFEGAAAGGHDANLALWLARAVQRAVQALGFYEVDAVVDARRLKLYKVHLACVCGAASPASLSACLLRAV